MMRQANDQRRFIRQVVGTIPQPRVVLVHAHDFDRDRVDVVFKDNPNELILQDVPVHQGTPRKWFPFKTITDDGDGNADMGLLVPVKTIGLRTFDTKTKQRGQGQALVYTYAFLPGFFSSDVTAPAKKDKNAGAGDSTKFNKDDFAIELPGGTTVIEKADGAVRVVPKAGKGVAIGDGAGVASFSKILTATATWDPASLSAGQTTGTAITVTGAAVGDIVMATFPIGARSMLLSGHVQATDDVRVMLYNGEVTTQDVGSGTLRVLVFKVI